VLLVLISEGLWHNHPPTGDYFYRDATALVGKGLLLIEDSDHTRLDTPHSAELLWTSDQSDADIPT
jgi:hypothetical protein